VGASVDDSAPSVAPHLSSEREIALSRDGSRRRASAGERLAAANESNKKKNVKFYPANSFVKGGVESNVTLSWENKTKFCGGP